MKKNKFQMIRFSGFSKEDQNDEPISYCRHCMGIRIMVGEEGSSYCDNCGCTSIGKTHIDLWVDSHRKKFGIDYLTGLEIPHEKCDSSEYKNDTVIFVRPLGTVDSAAAQTN